MTNCCYAQADCPWHCHGRCHSGPIRYRYGYRSQGGAVVGNAQALTVDSMHKVWQSCRKFPTFEDQLLAQTKLSCFWKKPDIVADYRAAVSLHSHTNHSKESLHFIPKFVEKWPVLQWALEHKCRQSRVPVDLVRAYWTPPLTAKLAFDVERDQIENELALMGMVSLTDHDTLAAPTLLRLVPETKDIPFSLEWSVPCDGAIFHLGIHNLPSSQAPAIMADLAAYTLDWSGQDVTELLAMLDQLPHVLIIFNHPLWDLSGIGQQRYREALNQFLQRTVKFLHAFELNATRTCKENNQVIQLADRWQRLLVSGGDRHGCEPSGALNLTRAQSISEFVREVRVEQRSHVLFMPQYAEPIGMRTTQALLDVIREYPQYPVGSRRWDGRVFHPDQATNSDQPVSVFWIDPPKFIGQVFSAIRLLENSAVRRVLTHFLTVDVDLRLPEVDLNVPSDIAYEATL